MKTHAIWLVLLIVVSTIGSYVGIRVGESRAREKGLTEELILRTYEARMYDIILKALPEELNTKASEQVLVLLRGVNIDYVKSAIVVLDRRNVSERTRESVEDAKNYLARDYMPSLR
jgi:hypothetical protein